MLKSALFAWSIEDWEWVGSPHHQWVIVDEKIEASAFESFQTSFYLSTSATVGAFEDFQFSVGVVPVHGMDHNIVWNFLDEENYYQLHFNMEEVWLTRFQDGSVVLSEGTQHRLVRTLLHTVEVRQDAETLSVRVDGKEIFHLEDNTRDERSYGLIGLKLAPGIIAPVTTQFTHFKFPQQTSPEAGPEEPEGQQERGLLIPSFRQDDSRWGNLGYDSAEEWSNQPTVGRWGCALTSLVMLFQYYGFEMLPGGEPLHPDTLNQWLLTQPDGYVGQGLVNWWAAARLSRILSSQYSTPEKKLPILEFSFQGLPWQEAALAQLAEERPIITHVPGHFFLIRGYDEVQDDFLITDPLYDYELLGEHSEPLSLRIFTPSHTDLSALVVSHPAETVVTITDSTGQVVSLSFEEWIEPDESTETSHKWKMTVVSQPVDGEYRLEWEGEASPNEATLLLYDQNGDASVNQTLTDKSGSLVLSFSKTGNTSTYPVFTWEYFIA